MCLGDDSGEGVQGYKWLKMTFCLDQNPRHAFLEMSLEASCLAINLQEQGLQIFGFPSETHLCLL